MSTEDLQHQQQQLQQAIGTLLPAFDAYVSKQTELNQQNIELSHRNLQKDHEKAGRLEREDLCKWVEEEARHVPNCDGDNVRGVREWIASVRSSGRRIPQGKGEDDYIKKLMVRTCSGDLFREIDNYMEKNNRDLVSWKPIIDHILEAFLGPDENEALEDELKKIKQGGREDIPAFNRRFSNMADIAYPKPTNSEKSELAVLYLTSLKKGRIQNRLADREHPVSTLEDATNAAYQEWARMRRSERILNPGRTEREEQPMEVDALTIREQLAEQDKELKALRKKVAERERSAAEQPAKPKPSESRKQTSQVICWYCDAPGHMKRDCKRNQVYWEKKGGERRPLPPDERAIKN
jgi:hypothetical protein